MGTTGTTLSDSFTLRGLWWLPATPNRMVSGTVSFIPEGVAELSLDGTLRDLTTGKLKAVSWPVIYGETLDGRLCTLFDVHESHFQLHARGITITKLFFNRLFIGKEFVTSNTVFESATVDLTDLAGWLHRDPFECEHNSGSGGKQRIRITHELPKMISFAIPSLSGSFRFEPTINVDHEYQKRTLRHTESLQVKPRRKESLGWYLDVIFKFQILLSLLVGEPVNLISIRLCVARRKHPQLGNKLIREYLDFCLKQVGKKKDKELLPPEILFTYPSLRNKFRAMLNNWYSRAARFQTVYGLYFGVTVNRSTPVEFQFLSLIQALESFHRAKGKDKYLSDTQYKPIRDALVASISASVRPDFRDSLKSKIKYGNEFSLRKRLTIILKTVPKTLLPGITDGEAAFIAKVVATRNYLTHRDESDKQNVMDLRAMFNATEGLRLLIMFLLLRECGVKEPRLETAIRNNGKFMNRPRIL